MLQTFDLYSVPALTAFVRSFTRIALAWTLVVAGLMAGAFFGKVGAEFSRVWIATWYGVGSARAVRRAARRVACWSSAGSERGASTAAP